MVAAFCLSTTLALVSWPGAYAPYFEGRYYFAMANGDFTKAGSYYAGRVFHPLIVHGVARLTGLPVDWRAFLIVSVISLVGFFCILGANYGLEFSVDGWQPVLLLASAVVVDQYRNYYWHDLFYAMLCAGLFLILPSNRWAILPILLAMFVTRESTLILVLVLIAVTAVRREWAFCAATLAIGAVGFGITGTLVRHASADHHGIPLFLLDLLKIPYNFALNVCGLEFWTNTIADTVRDPLKWVVNLPSWLHLGNIHRVGYCGFFWDRPLKVLVLMASAFGAFPLLIAQAFATERRRFLPRKFHDMIALAYGTAMFVLTPLVGTLPVRYALYAWPVFWIFGVKLVYSIFESRRDRMEFIFLCFVATWSPAAIRLATGPPLSAGSSLFDLSRTGVLLSLGILGALYLRAYRLTAARLRLPRDHQQHLVSA